MAADIIQPMRFVIDIDSGLIPKPQRSVLKQGDAYANRIIAEIRRGREPVDITGVTVTGAFVRPADGAVIELAGEAAGNEAAILLDDACYAVSGAYEANVLLELGSTKRTILTVTGHVEATGSGAAVISGEGGGESGGTGEDGGYYRPTVSSDGTLTWTPSKAGMPSVPSSNIKGPAGDDGVSPTVTLTRLEGGVKITVTDAEGEKSATVYDGEDGAGGGEGGGADGEDGGYYTPSVDSAGTLTWTASKAGMPDAPGANIMGPEGPQGPAGYTPEKGTDYFTEADKQEIVTAVLANMTNAAEVAM